MIFDTGTICVKLAGRDAGKKCVVVDVLSEHYVLIDGQTRRRKCNVAHLEPLKQRLELFKGAGHEQVKDAFAKIGVELPATTNKKSSSARPRKTRSAKAAPAKK